MTASAGGAAPTVYVVVLNWNGWRDTIACLESVLRSDWPAFRVVVCDNASADGSMERLVAWARGDAADGDGARAVDAAASAGGGLAATALPHAVLTRAQAERGGTRDCDPARVVFVQNGANLGYAGGCNVALRYALARGDCAYAWLLNNDTVVDAGALRAMVGRLAERPDAGLCGARVLYHDAPDVVQCWGGCRYNRWLGTTEQLGEGAPAARVPDVPGVERRSAYVYGASVLATRRFLDAVGLMDERYFLYFEELDWATRGSAFARVYAHDAVVYHREGRSIGSSSDWRKKSALSDYYTLRNRLLFTRRFFPYAVPSVYCGLVGALLNRLRRRQFGRAAMIGGLLRGRHDPPPPPPPRLEPSGPVRLEVSMATSHDASHGRDPG